MHSMFRTIPGAYLCIAARIAACPTAVTYVGAFKYHQQKALFYFQLIMSYTYGVEPEHHTVF